MPDFQSVRNQMRKVRRASVNLDEARAIAAVNAIVGGDRYEHAKYLRDTAEAAYNAARAELEGMRTELLPILDTIQDETKFTMLYKRYIKGKSAREIAYDMAYSEGYVFKIIRQAEKDLERG